MENEKKKLSAYYKPYKGLFLADMMFAMIGAAITLVIPLMVRYITGTVVLLPIEEASSTIIRLGIFMVLLVIVEGYCNYFIGYYGHVMGAKIEHDMRNEIFGHYQKLSFAFFDNQKVGHLLSRITSDLFDITELLHHGPEDVVISAIKLLGAFIILLVINAKLAFVAIGFVVIMLLYAVAMNGRMRGAFRENRARIADINSQIEDSLSGIRVVKSFSNEKTEMDKFEEGNSRFVDSKKKSYRYMGTYNSGMGVFSTLITVGSLLMGAWLMMKGELSAADLVTFLLYINNFTEPVKKLVNFTEQFQNGYSGYERFVEIMNIAPDIKDKEDAKSLDRVQGEIQFEDVSFHYSENKENVLSHVNLDVKPGEYVALVGSSGAGKTTLCSLIPRFYDVTGGAVRLDGIDIRDVKLKDLRRQIGIVQQDVYLFAGTILENIRYGKPEATDEEVVNAAMAANAHEFIMSLPEGYNTDIGQRGVKLSGGQKQRLSIARVFLKNPPVLIFDEATSALDNESEKIVQHSLELLAKDRTTFVIAHRLSTIRNAERILVLTEDGIAEEGTHESLLAQGGIYAGLYNMQF
ncbi:ABC transporter ATP-binding protein [Blautia faecicola]|uniref:ABC transporter ATP-binding protein n=1 Tax=Blautia faecicola TaxID=2509240 RepID=A0A4Q1RK83_9FIRM|nr:ABC transporter ATP-binding protein [Blautia faecicola]RXS76162.1 ABC transporter ATP-binding protein [Blautia faecicola]